VKPTHSSNTRPYMTTPELIYPTVVELCFHACQRNHTVYRVLPGIGDNDGRIQTRIFGCDHFRDVHATNLWASSKERRLWLVHVPILQCCIGSRIWPVTPPSRLSQARIPDHHLAYICLLSLIRQPPSSLTLEDTLYPLKPRIKSESQLQAPTSCGQHAIAGWSQWV
jgi:hypothetical protein